MADDLAADVWLAVARGLDRFDGDERGFRGWLFTIARHRIVEHRRRQARRRTEPLPTERLDRAIDRGLGRRPGLARGRAARRATDGGRARHRSRPRPGRGRAAARARRVRRGRGRSHHGPLPGQRPRAVPPRAQAARRPDERGGTGGMTEADDNVVELTRPGPTFEDVLAGGAPAADAPAWCDDLVRLVARRPRRRRRASWPTRTRSWPACSRSGGRPRRGRRRGAATASRDRRRRSRHRPPRTRGREAAPAPRPSPGPGLPGPRRPSRRVPRRARGRPHAGVGHPDRPPRSAG